MAAPPPGSNPYIQPPGAVPGFPLTGVRPPLIPVGPPLMMPMGSMPAVPGLQPAPGGVAISSGPELVSKPYQKPISVSEMKVATTVFVGNITDKATDSLVRQILLRCGYIVGWKRVQNASGKLQAFGFCEYSDPECTLRALRLLNGFELGDKKLVIKVDSNNRKELLKYLMKKKMTKNNEEFNDQILEREVDKIVLKGEAETLEEDIDKETKEEDGKVMSAINGLIKENISTLLGSKTSDDFRREKDVHESLVAMAIQSGRVDEDSTLDDVDMEDGMKTLVSDEIKRFRQSYQNYEEKQAEARMKRHQAKQDEKKKEEKSGRKRSRSRSPGKKSSRPKSPKKPRSRSQERRDREKERELRRKEEKERLAKEEEEYEQKLMERKRAEREKAFKDRLRQWEHREKRRALDYQYEREEEETKRLKLDKERKRMIEFFEDYDDEKQDYRYYKGSEFTRRHDDRVLEMEEDEYDRKKERDELEALRLEVMERQIREREEEQERKRREEEEERFKRQQEVNVKEESSAVDHDNLPISKQGNKSYAATIQVQLAPPTGRPKPELKSNPNDQTDIDSPPVEEKKTEDDEEEDEEKKRAKLTFGLSKKQPSTAAARASLEGIFGGEDEGDAVKPKKKLYSLMSSSNSAHIAAAMAVVPTNGKMSSENRKKLVQSLVNSIPSRREELFNWDLKWNYIDKTLMEKRVSPWINKKIVEYIGEPEPTLTEFICNKLAEQVPADGILNDIAMVLDDEAEVFVLKLWRLLIYETEARHLGIAKNY
ncbi:PREDICTED: RNA-binding protein 25-like [Amphimedon queenslandica]|uniref:PWI domain-containing protein n=1 Tax=Amphimedon queenslandica TaxID=400682 RepID=A0A1X7VDH2_AMPQE|nr:PREDICTED: RNA-binding protein 25-like [Amphimedon queenslandica]|eukprot:XP_011410501.2 PREDICTED: RNA-binding protein 25-like [Amphimedon queenslandica]